MARCNQRGSEVTLDLTQTDYGLSIAGDSVGIDLTQTEYGLCLKTDAFVPVERVMGYADNHPYGYGEATEEGDDFGFIGKERI